MDFDFTEVTKYVVSNTEMPDEGVIYTPHIDGTPTKI